jgi:integrase
MVRSKRPHGAGTLTERSPGVWRLRVLVRDPRTSKDRQVSETFHGGRREAERALAKMVTQADSGQLSPLTMTVADLLAEWLDFIEPSRSPNTIRGYRSCIHRAIIPVLGSVKLAKLTARDLDRAYAGWLGQALSPTTVHQYHAVLASALHQACRWGYIDRSPAVNASPPAARRAEPKPPSPDQVRQVIAYADDDDPVMAAFLIIAACTGARRAELVALRWSDIDWDSSQLVISRAMVHPKEGGQVESTTKTKRNRRVALDPVALAALDLHRGRVNGWAADARVVVRPDGFVFSYDPIGGQAMWLDRPTDYVLRLRKVLGIPRLRLHDLRHFAGTQLIGAGVDVRTVAGRLGHSDAATTLRAYAHFIEERDRSAAAILGQLVAGT